MVDFTARRLRRWLSCSKRRSWACFGAVQPHDAVGEHVFLDHVGQLVGRLLALLGELVEALGEHLHDPGDAGHQEGDDQRQLPVQVDQVAQQRDQREAIARKPEQRLHQQHRAGLHFVHHRVRQGARRLAREQGELGAEQALEQHPAQLLHAFVGDTREGILRDELRDAAHGEQHQHGGGHEPQRHLAAGEAAVEQRLQKGGHQRLGDRRQHGPGQAHGPPFARAAEPGHEARQTAHQGRARVLAARGCLHGGGFYGSPRGWLFAGVV
jgi:hypothetical protein